MSYVIRVKRGFNTGLAFAIMLATMLIGVAFTAPIVFAIAFVLTLIYIVRKLSGYSVDQITLTDVNTLHLKYKNRLGNEREEIYNVQDLSFTYRRRTVINSFPSMATVKYGNVLVLNSVEKTVLVLEPDKAGWSDGEIKTFARQLQLSGVKRVTELYSNVEVSI